MGMFDNDPAYQKLKALRDGGYKGPVDSKGNKTDKHADVFKALDKGAKHGKK
ncbi:hypothetical protein GAR05_06168 [Micromonospora saelicesensis]|uniref:MT0933-like antitoxin protein n=1 Tax=Micromonospora saelicesensis TaxID=285676 RepID=A0ABX9CB90_9ACTN|nr:hypothetical protein [Micromonospora saelicesensis]RAN92676.1 hypothetical protein GAR05_06168 [Micromonospora saelicesensis]